MRAIAEHPPIASSPAVQIPPIQHASAQWGLLFLAWMAAVDSRAPLFALSPYLDQVIHDLDLSFTTAGLLSSLSLALMGLLAIPGGLLADRIGPRRTVASMGLLVVVASLLRAVSPNAFLLVASTAGIGAAVGALQPGLPHIARDALPRRVGLATGIYSNGFTVGSFLATALAPFLLAGAGDLGWRGALLYWTGFSVLVALGWLWLARSERTSTTTRTSRPVSLRQVWRNPGVLPLALAFACQAGTFYGLMSWLPAYLKSLGWQLEDIAGPVAFLSITAIPTGLLIPALADRVGRRWLIVLAGVACSAGAAGFWLAPATATLLWCGLIGVGTTIAFSLALSGPAVYAPPSQIGATAGVILALGYVGAMLGPFLMGLLRDLTGDYLASMGFLVGVGVVMAYAGLVLPAEGVRRRPVH